ncbi:hypothetical protein RUM44_008004 [Polyplax serrata]|uniref:Uncharacterized protein n=1 Tax=Polyplax serrata TaxID=468196 RepID=A0ABR1BB29_POLSC
MSNDCDFLIVKRSSFDQKTQKDDADGGVDVDGDGDGDDHDEVLSKFLSSSLDPFPQELGEGLT